MKISIILAATFLAIVSCRDNSSQENHNDAVVKDTIISHEDQHGSKLTQVALNNGEKWVANTETTQGIRTMTALVNNFTSTPKLEDYRSLKVHLETEFNLILQRCTMKGEAHEQLHAYLMPMAEMFKQLNSSDMASCSEALDGLKKHLAEYGNYFQ